MRKTTSRRKANVRLPQGQSGSADLRQPQADAEGHAGCADAGLPLPSAVRDICEQIIVRHRERNSAMEQRKRLDNGLGAYIRTAMGWNLGLSEKERVKCAKQARFIISKNDDPRFQSYIDACKKAAEVFVDIEAHHTKTMAALAKQLPVWQQFESVRGLGAVSLAVIIGEAGDLANYSNHSKLWKRMGVAVLDGIRQGGLRKGADAEDWIAHGYSPKRRSKLWTIGDTLIKGNRDGRYRTAYLQRKAYEVARNPDIKPIAAHRKAQRYMEKRLLRDLWQAWRGPRSCSQNRPTMDCPRQSFLEAAE